jgi:hypothetical protein
VKRFLLGSGSLVLLSLPVASHAQTSSSTDLRYCAALSQVYMRYIGNPETEPRNIRRNDAAADEALSQCRHGNAAASIPVLERKLTDNRFILPPRE